MPSSSGNRLSRAAAGVNFVSTLVCAKVWPEVTNGLFLSHKRTERERRCAGVAEFRGERRLSLRTALTGNRWFPTGCATTYRSLKTGNPLFPLDITLRPFGLCPLMCQI
jgi:hypothetical protein